MTNNDACEIAYKNGYEQGLKDAVKHGRWVRLSEHSFRPVCSECGYYGSAIDAPVNPFNYCPNCGSKMDGGKET